MNKSTVFLSTALAVVGFAFVTACGGAKGLPEARVAGLPSLDANVASLRVAFSGADQITKVDPLLKKSWSCYQFSAMKDIADSSTFVRTFNTFGSLYITDAVFNGARSTGSVAIVDGALRGGVTGTTDGFVFPYDNVEIEIRMQRDGTLVEEWTANPRAMVLSLKNGLNISALSADAWMVPAVSNPSRVTFVYSVCRPQ